VIVLVKRPQDKVGFEFDSFHRFRIEPGKIKEFALAIGDPNPAYQTGEVIPPTFATAIEMWGGPDFFTIVDKLDLNLPKVLHGEQEYEYVGKIHAGDELSGSTKVISGWTKADMYFYRLETTFINSNTEQPVLIARSTVIERK
jgi:hypothetical protein